MPRSVGSRRTVLPVRNPVGTRALQLIDRLAERQEFMVSAYMAAVKDIPSYGRGPVEDDELRRAAARSFTILIDCLREQIVGGGDEHTMVEDMAGDLARRRAAQGIELAHLVEAVRIDFTVLWEQLKGISSPEDAVILVEMAEPLRHVVEDYASAVYSAFLDLREAQARRETAVLQQYLAELLTHRPTTDTLSRMATALGWAPGEPLALAAAPAGHAQLKDFAARHAGTAPACHATTMGAHDLVVFPRAREALLEQVMSLPCALVDPVAGLETLADAHHRAAALVGLLRPTDVTALTMQTAWPRISAAANAALGNDLGTALQAALGNARPSEATRIRETVEVFLRTGSAKQTAALTYCHRNTVLNHLNRFAELTGLDVTVPEQAARVVIAWA